MSSEPLSLSNQSMPFPPGTILAGKYRVERLLGEGGMGWVVQAIHLQLDQRVALKFMHASSANESPEAVARFLREARAAARIQSEHVARVSDVGTLETGAPYLVMEYLEGEDLDSVLRSRSGLPVEEAMDYALQACEGLAEAHAAGIVHRDLKPANLFLARRSDGSVRVKLLDFGISKVAPVAGSTSDGAKTGTQSLMGSPLYMAPEQMRSTKNVDRRADIWSMGVILYEMLSGRSPFNGDTLPEICARILADPPPSLPLTSHALPAGLEAVVLRCLEKEPALRFPDVATLARALAPFGQPELRASAERIGRMLKVGAPSLPEITTPPRPPLALGASPLVAQTSASFGTAASPPRMGRAPATALGLAGVAAVAAVLIAVVATRGRQSGAPAVSAASLAAPGGTGTPAPASTPTSASAAGPGFGSAPTPGFGSAPTPGFGSAPTPGFGSAPTPGFGSGSPSASAPPLASPSARAAAGPASPRPAVVVAHAAQRPKAAATTSVPKPSATTGFGGRD